MPLVQARPLDTIREQIVLMRDIQKL